jgi:hypothetical protein
VFLCSSPNALSTDGHSSQGKNILSKGQTLEISESLFWQEMSTRITSKNVSLDVYAIAEKIKKLGRK